MFFRSKDRTRNERGSVVLEISLATPMMVTLLFGTIEFGQALVAYHNLVGAAAEAARVGTQSSCPRPTTARVLEVTRAMLSSSGMAPSLATIDLTNVGGESGTDLQVDLRYNVEFPVLSRLLQLTSLSDGALTVAVHVEAENE